MSEGGMQPPARKQPLASNSDFRKLLETPRPGRGGDGSIPTKGRAQLGGDSQKPKKKSRPKPVKEEAEDEGPQYRDRAEERRKGYNPDYERENLVTGGISATADLNGLSVEDSKFLGGDVDHTHLVKGLDYALLQKVRGEMGKDDAEEGTAQKKAFRQREVVKFASAAGRSVFNTIFNKPKIPANELFLPGRTAFVFELEGASSADVPTTLRRSKADCPPVVETVTGGMDGQVLERMVKIMSYMTGSSGRSGKLKRKEKLRMLQMMDDMNGERAQVRPDAPDAAQAMGPADADADIFGDAGRDIVMEDPKSAAAQNGSTGPLPPPPPAAEASVGPARPAGGYNAAAAAYAAYGDEDEAAPPPPPPPAGHQPQSEEDLELDRLGGFAPLPPSELDPPKTVKPSRKKQLEEEEAIAKDGDDAYEECYPAYGGFSGVAVDSDEEDLTHMDNNQGKSRYDFGTEQEWEKYKSKKEMMPKAAFQFGVKMSDGRKATNKLGKHVEQKEQQQLKKIQSMFKENHGEKYKNAFDEDTVGKGPSKKRRI